MELQEKYKTDYDTLRKQIDDKKLYEKTLTSMSNRRQALISYLELHGTSYDKTMVQGGKGDSDPFGKVFGDIEILDTQISFLISQIKSIEAYLKEIDNAVSSMNDLEKKVFKWRFLYDLPIRTVAERLDYSEDRINQVIADIKNK